MTDQEAIERITQRLALADGDDYPLPYYRGLAREAWNEAKAIARDKEQPRTWAADHARVMADA